ncbi:MAG TPA: copper chaperone PCu(A)C [Casimicrobiaceae bacterium]|nr:copper chaperone PCu(A)C [Casimicrobiaceae bacterium]
MNRFRSLAIAALAAAFAIPAAAHDYSLAALKIAHPYARATPPGADIGGAYLTIDNKGAADRLMSASSPAAARVELHTMAMDNGVMRMSEVKGIDLPPGSQVKLKPGGLHMMLVGLKTPLAEGSRVPLRLTFEHAGSIDVEVAVESMSAGAMKH